MKPIKLVRFTNPKTCPQIYKTQRHLTITLSFFHIPITNTKTGFKIPSTIPKSLHALIQIYRPKQTQMAKTQSKKRIPELFGKNIATVFDINGLKDAIELELLIVYVAMEFMVINPAVSVGITNLEEILSVLVV